MSLGCRFVKRGKRAGLACLALTPREPLLFLYPSWRSYSTSSPAPDPAQDGDPRSFSHNDLAYQAFIRPQFNVESARESLDLTTRHEQDMKDEGAGNQPPSSEVELPTAPQFQKLATGRTKNCPPASKTPFERRISFLHSNFKRTKAQEVRKRSTRHAYLEYVRERRASWVPDWRPILGDLCERTPDNERRLMTVEVSISKDSVGTLLKGIDDNMWDIAERYSCAVELCAQEPRIKVHQTFLLSGPQTAISKMAADIIRVDPNVKMKATTTGLLTRSSEGNFAGIANIRREGVQRPRSGKARKTMSAKPHVATITRAENIPRPTKWTQQSFAEYVAALTASAMPNHLYKLMHRPAEDRKSSIVKILRETFLDPECRPSLSRKAFNTAMEYFVGINRIVDTRAFFVHMELMGIPLDVKTFNIMLRGAAKNEDLHNFQFILHLMLRRNILPNFSTWIAFVMLVPDLRIKLYAFEKMKELGLLWNIDTMKDVCKHLVVHEISASLDNSQSQTEFLNHMDSRYGPAWLTKISGSQIIEVLGLRGLISRCWSFLFVMTDRSITPHVVCINTILNHCKQVGNIRGALELLRNLPPSIIFNPDEATFHILFAMAWRGKRYNLARVVWRYACLNASTTRSMRLRVVTSLLNSQLTPEPKQSSYKFFGHTAGLIISPIEDFQSHPVIVYRQGFKDAFGFDPVEDSYEIEELLVGNNPGENPATSPAIQSPHLPKSLNGFSKHISHDCEVFQWWTPVRPFIDMVTEACKLDEEWKNLPPREDGQNAERISRLLQNAISVPIRAEIGGKEILTEWR